MPPGSLEHPGESCCLLTVLTLDPDSVLRGDPMRELRRPAAMAVRATAVGEGEQRTTR